MPHPAPRDPEPSPGPAAPGSAAPGSAAPRFLRFPGRDGTVASEKAVNRTTRAALVLCLLVLPVGARAQREPRFIVVRTLASADPAGFRQAADDIGRLAREARPGLTVEQAVRAIEERHSAEAVATTSDDLDALARESEAALEHVAFGRRRQAAAAVTRILERAQAAIETLNRETRSARRVLNSCLYLVRALADSGDETAALEQSVDCARLVPDLLPAASEHPPNVRQLFQQAAAELDSGPHGGLRVDSEPQGCAVYLNGRRLGSTPFRREELPTGEYRVQVECTETGRPGRVHRIVLSAEPREIVIDSRFDTVLRTSGRDLRLEYASVEEEQRWRLYDATLVAELVEASDLLMVTPEGDAVLRVDRVDVLHQRVIASVRLAFTAEGIDADAVRRGVAHLLAPRSMDLTGETEREMRAWVPARGVPRMSRAALEAQLTRVTPAWDDETPPDLDDADGDGGVWVGVGLAAGGFVSLAAAWGVQVQWSEKQAAVRDTDPLDSRYPGRVEDRDGYVLPTLVLGGAGALLGTAALPFLLDDEGPAWWHWTLAGTGALGTAIGAILWSREGSCENTMCTSRERTVPLGPLLIATSVPLLAMPVVALVMEDGDSVEALSVQAVPLADGGLVMIRGTYR